MRLMRKKFYLNLLLFLLVSSAAMAQGGKIKGTVRDAKTNAVMPFVNVAILKDGSVTQSGAVTNINGIYSIANLDPGTYDVRFSFTGYATTIKANVLVTSGKTTDLNIRLGVNSKVLETVVIEEFIVPLISRDNVQSGTTTTRADLDNVALRNVTNIAAASAGVYTSDDGGAASIRGSRTGATEYFIDGVRVRGSLGIPNAAIEQSEVITGGISAAYGDVTGGVISLTTRGPSSKFSGTAEIISSQFLDSYGYNLGALSFSGPLLFKNKGEKEQKVILGYSVSSEFELQQTPDPAATGVWQLKDDVLQNLQDDPYRQTGGGITPNALFVTADDMELQKTKPNADRTRMSFQGKLDFQPTNSVRVVLGANYIRQFGKNYGRGFSLFNSQNNSEFDNTTFRSFLRFQQKFGNDTSRQNKGIIENASYQIQIDYTKTTTQNQNADLGQNPFAYGYLGKFDRSFSNNYGLLNNFLTDQGDLDTAAIRRNGANYILSNNGDTIVGFSTGNVIAYHNGFSEDNVSFTPANYDPVYSNYGADYFGTIGQVGMLSDILSNGGLINGTNARSVYGIWSAPGTQSNGYSYSNNDFFRLTARGNAEIKGHTITFGIEYDQRIDRFYRLSPFVNGTNGLWGNVRALTNTHISQLDLANPILGTDIFGFVDSISYNRNYVADQQSTLDKNLRQSLGLPADGLDLINVDNLNPEDLQLDFFSANELINNGRSFIGYYGYDHTGKKSTENRGALEFFSDTINRPIGAFSPIYSAVFLEDKFDFDDLIFRVGVRVDRFDANQPVLKDPYLFAPARTVAEATDFTHPSTVGDDFVVYVDDIENPTRVLGYREENQWYNSQGQKIGNATNLENQTSTGSIAPYLKSARFTPGTVDAGAFEDYTPQINVMPRISFSFPISEDALFFAHYDILTERPVTGLRFNPIQYSYISTVFAGGLINNPNLRPQKTIDYELGFRQRVSPTSGIKISAFYREFRDLIQVVNVLFAYPAQYQTYGNDDFGTAKGLSLEYDLRRTGNIRLTANYTLQFAEGTGSNATTARSIISAAAGSGIDIVRPVRPLDFDSRHQFAANVDFRYGEGAKYNGPKIGKTEILKNMGFNLIANASSGTPYSKKAIITADGDVINGITGVSRLDGQINGSNLPWNIRLNLRVDKDFNIKVGKTVNSDNKEVAKYARLKVYLWVNNLLDTRNVVNVYAATGSAEDDGFLSSPLGEQQISEANSLGSGQSFIDLYSASLQNPNLFSRPRTVRLGVRFSF